MVEFNHPRVVYSHNSQLLRRLPGDLVRLAVKQGQLQLFDAEGLASLGTSWGG
jgi:hypothetical protein